MGIYDRDYMRVPNKSSDIANHHSRSEKESSSLSWWQRFLFKLWLIFHPRRQKKANKSLRVVIDTNSLVAARFKQDGDSNKLLKLCIAGKVQALISEPIERENRHILEKVRPTSQFWDQFEQFLNSAETVTELPDVQASEDPADNKFLECALGGRADYIISSDHHLRDLNPFQGIKITSAGKLLNYIKKTQ